MVIDTTIQFLISSRLSSNSFLFSYLIILSLKINFSNFSIWILSFPSSFTHFSVEICMRVGSIYHACTFYFSEFILHMSDVRHDSSLTWSIFITFGLEPLPALLACSILVKVTSRKGKFVGLSLAVQFHPLSHLYDVAFSLSLFYRYFHNAFFIV